MKKIKPSEGLNLHPGTRVHVYGRISGTVHYSSESGGRWIVPVCDRDSIKTPVDAAVVSVNLKPEMSGRLPHGIKKPLPGLVTLFSEDSFKPLFRLGTPFKAEAILGYREGIAWFNVSELIIFEPDFPVGVRQIIAEPTCQRRIMLSSRRISSSRFSVPNRGKGGFIVGDLVHAIFEEIATSPDREGMVKYFKEEPDQFLAQLVPRDISLKATFCKMGDRSFVVGSETRTAKKHLFNLVNSQTVMNLINSDDWQSETPASSNIIDGRIDLRSSNRIIELKTNTVSRKEHREQIQLYLVSDMIEFGVDHVREKHSGYIINSSSQIDEDAQRVVMVGDSMDMLNRFLTARHRYLLTSGYFELPRIEIVEDQCEKCFFYKDDKDLGKPSACHFYCQIDRSWECNDCMHQSSCDQSHVLHSYEVLDDANRIRETLIEEIRIYRKGLESEGTSDIWEQKFTVVKVRPNMMLTLQPEFSSDIDPPSTGTEIQISFNFLEFPISGEVIHNGFNSDHWLVSVSGNTSRIRTGMTCWIYENRSRLRGVFGQLSCVDELQRRSNGSSVEGIAFAGGRTVSGKLETFNSIQTAEKSGAIDIFCQSFGVRESWRLLKEFIENKTPSSVLLVTENAEVKEKIQDTAILQAGRFQKIIYSGGELSAALNKLKDHLTATRVWIASPDFAMSECLSFLPNSGNGYFDYLILYETQSASALEYYLLRNYGKKRICIGDANSLGSPAHSSLPQRIGLGDNILHRVLTRGFPTTDISKPVIVTRGKQEMLNGICNSLAKCKLELPTAFRKTGEILFRTHQKEPLFTPSVEYLDEYHIEVNEQSTKEVLLQTDHECSVEEVESDLRDLSLSKKLNIALSFGETLHSNVSGNSYKVITPPKPPTLTDLTLMEGKWIIRVRKEAFGQRVAVNHSEAEIVVDLARNYLDNGVKSRNLAIISLFRAQLKVIADLIGTSAKGVSFRTPYNIRGASWGTVIISCVLDSLVHADAEITNPRLFYTIFRSGVSRVVVVGHRNFIENHPFLRNIDIGE